jgi:hypothetical protein
MRIIPLMKANLIIIIKSKWLGVAETLSTVNSLGGLYYKLGRVKEAEANGRYEALRTHRY